MGHSISGSQEIKYKIQLEKKKKEKKEKRCIPLGERVVE